MERERERERRGGERREKIRDLKKFIYIYMNTMSGEREFRKRTL